MCDITVCVIHIGRFVLKQLDYHLRFLSILFNISIYIVHYLYIVCSPDKGEARINHHAIEISISNYFNSYFKKFVFKKLHLFTFDFYQAIEISRSNYFNSYFKKKLFLILVLFIFSKRVEIIFQIKIIRILRKINVKKYYASKCYSLNKSRFAV